MSDFKLTEAQRDAVISRGSSILVSAGAGSGKTMVLVKRLMTYILDEENPKDIDSFVIITFTKAAAAQLRTKINEKLTQAAAEKPDNAHLRRQPALLRRAYIGTIHSFCASVLRENAHMAGISSDFSILSDERAVSMKAAAIDKVMNGRYREIDSYPGFETLVNTVGTGRDDKKLVTLVLDLYEKMQCHSRPDKWAEEVIAGISREYDDFSDSPWGKVMLGHYRAQAEYWAEEMDALLQEMQNDESVRKAYGASIAETADGIRELNRRLKLGWQSAEECPEILFPRFGTCKGCTDEELKEKVKNCRDKCKKEIQSIRGSLKGSTERFREEMKYAAEPMTALLRLVLDFGEEYAESKKRGGYLDYSDLEHKCAVLLTDENNEPTPLAYGISSRFTEILVDEYQDVSGVQDVIFNAISANGKKLFLVGDAKQSIYRFRLANPEIFNDKYNRFKPSAEAGAGESKKILLRENFRSCSEVLECANSVFMKCMSAELGDIQYGEDTRLIFGAESEFPNPLPIPEIDLIAGSEEFSSARGRRSLEAYAIAEKIRSLVSENTGLKYGDIAILLRNSNSVGKIYGGILTALGIPVASGAGESYFDSKEIMFICSMLKAMDNPHMDIPLLAVLGSPFFGFTPDDLSEIRINGGGGDIYTALCSAAKTNEKCASFLAMFNSLRKSAPDSTADRIVWDILDCSNILPICSAMKDGARRQENIMYFLQLAVDFEADGYHGLHNFVLYLTRLMQKKQEAPATGEQKNAVHIVSIHKSKGLEYPVVFLSDIGHQFNKQDLKADVVLHPELGIGPDVIDTKRMIRYSSLAKEAICLKLDREALSEEMRLMYVALTRPKKRLFITAAVNDPEKKIADVKAAYIRPGNTLHPEALAGAKAPVDWFIAAALADNQQHIKLKVVSAENVSTAEKVPDAHEEQEREGAYEELKRNLEWKYPFSDAEKLPSKITATELKNLKDTEDSTEAANLLPARKVRFRKPDLEARNKPATGAEKGIATHLILQYMNMEKAGSPEDVSEEIERLAAKRFISPRQAAAVDISAIVKLFSSPLGERMRSADKVHREFRFSVLCDASELISAAPHEELLLQGVVDCCLEEKGELIIVDYKTDYISSEAQLEEKKEYYSSQVKAYSYALSRIFSMPVKETVLYFLSIGKEIVI